MPTVTSTAKIPPVPYGFGREYYYVPAPDFVLAPKSVGDEADGSLSGRFMGSFLLVSRDPPAGRRIGTQAHLV